MEAIESRFRAQDLMTGAVLVEAAGATALAASGKTTAAGIVGVFAVTHGVTVVAIVASGVRRKDRETLLALANEALLPEPEAEVEQQAEVLLETQTQPTYPALPIALVDHALIATPEGIVLAGGTTRNFGEPQPKTWVLKDGVWTQGADLDTPRTNLTLVPDGLSWKVVGGVAASGYPEPRYPKLPDDRTDASWAWTAAHGWVVVGGLMGKTGQVPAPSAVALVGERSCPASPLAARQNAALVELEDGRVAMLGGERVIEGAGMGGFNPPQPVAETTILDPATCEWTQGPPLKRARANAAAVLTPDGVLVTGGMGFAEPPNASVELWQP